MNINEYKLNKEEQEEEEEEEEYYSDYNLEEEQKEEEEEEEDEDIEFKNELNKYNFLNNNDNILDWKNIEELEKSNNNLQKYLTNHFPEISQEDSEEDDDDEDEEKGDSYYNLINNEYSDMELDHNESDNENHDINERITNFRYGIGYGYDDENDDQDNDDNDQDDNDDDDENSSDEGIDYQPIYSQSMIQQFSSQDNDDNDNNYIHLSNNQKNNKISKQYKKEKGKNNNGKKVDKLQKKKGGKNNQQKQKQKQQSNASLKEIERKHKMWLLEVVEKKRMEEEELMKKIEKSELRRKKFKEALVEKARKKQLQQQEQAQQPQPIELPAKPIKKKIISSKPSQHISNDRNNQIQDSIQNDMNHDKDDNNNNDLIVGNEEEEILREEEEAQRLLEEAIKLRKKFKKHQKQILESLKQKKEEEERRAKEEEEKEQLKKEKLKKRNEKLLRKREKITSENDQLIGNNLPAGSGIAAVRASRSQGEIGLHTEDDGFISDIGEKSQPRKSKRSHSINYDNEISTKNNNHHNNSASSRYKKEIPENDDDDCDDIDHNNNNNNNENNENNENDEYLKEQRKVNAKKRQEKVQSYLSNLAEKKREEAELIKKKEDRTKKRAILLAQRLQAEIQERKLMAREDKYSNPGNIGNVFVTKPEFSKGSNSSNDSNQQQQQQSSSTVTATTNKKKVTPEMADAMLSRLLAKQAKAKDGIDMQPQARDFNDWKKKHSVPPNSRVFCMTGWYPCVKAALLQRGWYFNPDNNSPYFDMKWTLRSSDISDSLQPWQLTNHFLKNIALTTKVGLLKSLQQLVWLANTSSTEIIPRGYDLSNPQEIQEYLDDFRIQEAECKLKHLYYKLTGIEKINAYKKSILQSPPSTSSTSNNNNLDNQLLKSSEEIISEEDQNEYIGPVPEPIVELDKFFVNEAVFNACCNVLSRYQRPYYISEHIDNEIQLDDNYAISPLEWELIESYDIYKIHTLPENGPEPIDEFLQERKDNIELNTSNMTSKQRNAVAQANRQKREQRKHDQNQRHKIMNDIKKLKSLTYNDLETIHLLLCRSSIINSTQKNLNGRGLSAKNMWIVKPAAKSRGRGITTFNNINKLLDYVELGRSNKSVVNTSSHWIVQKYMENSLIIANRKFDLRQWVLVADWNPLKIYFYHECYARFSVEEYTISDDVMDNCYVHLVNNSIGKNSENFHNIVTAENGVQIEGFMWSYENFTNYIEYKSQSKETVPAIRKRMKDIAIWALMCGADSIEHRKNSWELYGFDYMIDDDFTPWLIEINSSPACDYSTKVTEVYVQAALVELLNVVLDVREWESTTSKKNRDNIPCPNTGGWENIYTGPFLETPSSSFGTDISIKGEPMKLPRKKNPIDELNNNSPSSQHIDSESFMKQQNIQQQNVQQQNKKTLITHKPSFDIINERKNNFDEKIVNNNHKIQQSNQLKKEYKINNIDNIDDDDVDDNDNNNDNIGNLKKQNSLDDSESDDDENGEYNEEERMKRRMNRKQNKTKSLLVNNNNNNVNNNNNIQSGIKSKKNESIKSGAVNAIPIKTFSMEL